MPKARHDYDDEDVRPILLRMGESFVDDLDLLADINRRSRREIVEMLIDKAMVEYEDDNTTRITP